MQMTDIQRRVQITPDVWKKAMAPGMEPDVHYDGDLVQWTPPIGLDTTVKERNLIYDSVVDAIGNTPMIRLSRFASAFGLECEILAKCEFLNPGGSVKDRIAAAMIEDAEEKGTLKPGGTLIEATSGNTGMGLSMCAAAKGYNMIVVLPKKMSEEKSSAVRVTGAEVVRTENKSSFHPESHISMAQRFSKVLPNAVILDQYKNGANPAVHYSQTAGEILQQTGGKIDAVVVCAGTGGTITGVAARVKAELPGCEVVGVDPHGSILAEPQSKNARSGEFYTVEGIGYDFIPDTLNRSLVDNWVKSDDDTSYYYARKLAELEGVLAGGSSGGAMMGAVDVARRRGLGKGQRVVVILSDGLRNYTSKFPNDSWMYSNCFMKDAPLYKYPFAKVPKTLGDLDLPVTPRVSPDATITETRELLRQTHRTKALLVYQNSEFLGFITSATLADAVLGKGAALTDSIEPFVIPCARWLSPRDTLEHAMVVLDVFPVAVVAAASEVLCAIDHHFVLEAI